MTCIYQVSRPESIMTSFCVLCFLSSVRDVWNAFLDPSSMCPCSEAGMDVQPPTKSLPSELTKDSREEACKQVKVLAKYLCNSNNQITCD